MRTGYNEDLAHIHDVGFGHLARSATPLVIESLQRTGVDDGVVVDLGCGSGITARLLRDAGFHVLGIDLSEPLLETARARVPDAEFRCASYRSADLPRCVAVTAIGEVFNYTFDDGSDSASRQTVFERIHDALVPGGLFVFDMAGPARVPSPLPRRHFVEDVHWTVLVETTVDDADGSLLRHITTFRKTGDLYRRDRETHRLQLVDPAAITAQLRRTGFTVQQLNAYGPLSLPPGLTGFLASKPG